MGDFLFIPVVLYRSTANDVAVFRIPSLVLLHCFLFGVLSSVFSIPCFRFASFPSVPLYFDVKSLKQGSVLGVPLLCYILLYFDSHLSPVSFLVLLHWVFSSSAVSSFSHVSTLP